MQKRVSCLALGLALFLTLSAHAAAAERSANVVVDGKTLEPTVATEVVNQNTYVSYWPVVRAMYPDAAASWENGQSVTRANGLTISVCPGAKYIIANGRYLYVPDGVRSKDGSGPRTGSGTGRKGLVGRKHPECEIPVWDRADPVGGIVL